MTGPPGDRPPVPDRAECERLLDAHRVPAHIRRHSAVVARVALLLGRELQATGEHLDLRRIEAGALLHDIAKAPCLATHGDHAREGAEVLRGEGYPSVAVLVERHVELGPWDPDGEVTEAELLNYSDKRVRHEEVVGLSGRFQDLLVRYGSVHPEAEARIRRNWTCTEAVERKIFARLPFGPEEVGKGDGRTGGR
ncbi:MAG: HD domain-containing protein [Proteobacteria bacterium]|nr:HD domain-containing protein [Pseudomonadota bacterium]